MNAQLTGTEQAHMRRALELAERGRGRVSPNPLVGAVVVRDGESIGEGFHAELGDLHAERAALADCEKQGQDPAGATMYVTLEPCAHQGRQPPCTEAILEAGISRVVIASDDPSEKAAGRGPGVLRDGGVEVEFAAGDEATAARLLNQPFRKHARTGTPLVTLKLAMSLDGRTSTPLGDSPWISNERSRELVQRRRAESDAIAVGIGTVLADDPLLTARPTRSAVPLPRISQETNIGSREAGRSPASPVPSPRMAGQTHSGSEVRQPLRVVFDRHARLPLDSQLLRTLDQAPVLVVVAPDTDASRLREVGAEVVVADGIEAALAELGRRGVTSLLLEGGATLAAAFAAADAIDEAQVFVAPVLLAGSKRIAALDPGAEDTLIETRFREW